MKSGRTEDCYPLLNTLVEMIAHHIVAMTKLSPSHVNGKADIQRSTIHSLYNRTRPNEQSKETTKDELKVRTRLLTATSCT